MWFVLTSLTLLFYSFLRLAFLAWNYQVFQPLPWSDLALAFLMGLRFDLSVVAILSAPAWLASWIPGISLKSRNKFVLGLMWIFHVPFLILNLGEIEFVQLTGRRFTLDLMRIAGEAQGKVWSTMLAYEKLLIFATLFVLLYLILTAGLLGKVKESSRGIFRKIFEFVLVTVLLVVAARGGLQKKPFGFAHAQIFASPSLNHLTLNSSFTLIQSLRRRGLVRENFMSQEKMRSLMNGPGPSPSELMGASSEPFGKFKGKQNVVIIILESFSYEHMRRAGKAVGYTPFLDELAEKSLFFDFAFANGRRSIEGIGAVLGGIPALMSEPFISSQYATNQFFGLGTLLAQEGYSSEFFHGGENGTMYFDQFARSAGIQKYFGASEYRALPGFAESDLDGIWGVWDQPFFQASLREMGEMPRPFLASVFSLSSHNPFRVPDSEQGKFPKGTSEIHEVVGYTDAALRNFFAEAEKQDWYQNTLFIVTADHTYKPVRPEFQNELGQYRIPILFFHPQIAKWPHFFEASEPVQQIDLIPSLMDFLQVPLKMQNLMGRSVFRPGSRFVTLKSDGFYSIIAKDFHLMVDEKNEARLFQNSTMNEITDQSPLLQSVRGKFVDRLQAIQQYFSQGLWDNRLYFPAGK